MLYGVGLDDVGTVEADGLGAGLDVGTVEADGLGAGLDDVRAIEPDGLAALDAAGLDDVRVLDPVGALAASSGLPRLDAVELDPGTPAPIVKGPGAGAHTWQGGDPDLPLGADGRVTDLSE